MSAAYDKYDYPSYWTNRKYEHLSEVHALTKFLKKIPKIKKVIEIGAGYGRLVPSYVYRAKKLTLSDPSQKLLNIAKKEFKTSKNITYVHSSLETLDKKIRSSSFDLVIMVRVLHHIKNTEKSFKIIHKILRKKGYFVLEFPNKTHFKANIERFLKGDFTFPLDIFTKDLTKKKKKVLPFNNYHPDTIIRELEKQHFEIIEIRSVSNIRSSFLKRYLPLETRITLEKHLQKPLSHVYFGPSIFVLAKKRSK